MLPENQTMDFSTMIALSREQLSAAGYRVFESVEGSVFPGSNSILAEDKYNILAILTFDTWSELVSQWAEAQATLVSVLEKRLARSSPKFYDAYLVLLCSGTSETAEELEAIERDTSRVRKIVATNEKLSTTADLARILNIFMPLNASELLTDTPDILGKLPELMDVDVDQELVKVAISAFKKLSPPLTALHEKRTQS